MNATDILGQLLGGGQNGSGSLNSGTGAKMLEDLLGVGSGGNQQGGQGGGVFGGGQTGGSTSGGNAGGTLGQQNTGTSTGGGGLGDLLGKALKELGGTGNQTGAGNSPFGQTPQMPQISQSDQSEVYIRAMIQAGLADGRLDEQEQQTIVQKVGNMGQQEQNFIRSEMAKGLDVAGFIQSVPRGIEEEVYAVSLMAIQLDNPKEAQFLDSIAKGLRITQEQSNAIHDRFGVQRLYS